MDREIKRGGRARQASAKARFCAASAFNGLGRQYIDPMRLTGLLQNRLGRLPSVCLVCARWPAQPICEPCANRYGAPRYRCATCAKPLQGNRHPQCGACLAARQGPPLAHCLAAVDYAYPWDKLIARFKFRREPALAQPLATLMLRDTAMATLLRQCDSVVPIPVTPERLAQRGYNQAWELANASALVRIGQAPDQHDLPAEQRVKNLRGAFAVDPAQAPRVQNAHIVLVDDVSTTGATLRAAAIALKQAGAAQVSAMVLARTAD
jgi:ComF family protein